ncbi:glutaminyl-peptide cyclotransferase [Pedobacter endophyticus]|uniref:Glutaminyl-peptide cyclotransferase n=1 Tax=Pedobacter endophyticus TaxID=2789740 RepID=A0A7S9Q1B2_9SPHI|nr:glutaminyl-peptide cyclotransferase [Pedobacter endophyticus]QPH41616.1 glutaminyl-peptide cyclotransferase [Pedobacter endophyticus]
MLFGPTINRINKLVLFGIILGLVISCKDETPKTYRSFVSPMIGLNIPSGNEFEVKVLFGNESKVDSVVYLIDSAVALSKTDTSALKLKTAGLKLGSHLLTARIYEGGKTDELTSNINILAAQPPVEYTYKVIKTLPHDTSSYVEGLEYHDGFFYESAGDYGHSSLRKVDPATGKVLQKADLDKQYFGEGMTVIGDKIIQLTYREKVGFVYDKATFKKIAEFPYNTGREGWGLTFDGKQILNTDGSNTIFFLDKDNYSKVGSIDVYDNTGAIQNLNELEVIDGKIYANVYTTNNILIINPETGAVEGRINLIGLLPENYFKNDDERANNVLNGIAYDKAAKRLFVTGKKWPHIFQIQLVKK